MFPVASSRQKPPFDSPHDPSNETTQSSGFARYQTSSSRNSPRNTTLSPPPISRVGHSANGDVLQQAWENPLLASREKRWKLREKAWFVRDNALLFGWIPFQHPLVGGRGGLVMKVFLAAGIFPPRSHPWTPRNNHPFWIGSKRFEGSTCYHFYGHGSLGTTIEQINCRDKKNRREDGVVDRVRVWAKFGARYYGGGEKRGARRMGSFLLFCQTVIPWRGSKVGSPYLSNIITTILIVRLQFNSTSNEGKSFVLHEKINK